MKFKFDKKWFAIAVAVVFVLLIAMWFFRREGYTLTSDDVGKISKLYRDFNILVDQERKDLSKGISEYIEGGNPKLLPPLLGQLDTTLTKRGKPFLGNAITANFSNNFSSPPVVKNVLTLDDINKINTLIGEFNIDPLDHESLRKGIIEYKDKKQRPLMPVDFMVLEPKYNGLFSTVQDRFFPVSTSQQSATAQGGQLELVSGNMGPPPLPQVFKGFRCVAF